LKKVLNSWEDQVFLGSFGVKGLQNWFISGNNGVLNIEKSFELLGRSGFLGSFGVKRLQNFFFSKTGLFLEIMVC
jgi:hypothetical protein